MKNFSARAAHWLRPFSFLALLILPQLGRAQTYDFVGQLVDADRGEPIGGAEARTPDGKLLGTTQSTGRFELTVNNRRAHVIFSHPGYKDRDVDLSTLPDLIDAHITMESSVQELSEVTAYGTVKPYDPSQAHTIDELELLQGMRMDLNDDLRQLHGVAGMNEWTNDISVYGSRTQDVTHYLGESRIPSLRHLDFGFPGNESVINPRVLKSITVADNLARGPLDQGNASALVYELQDGDPEAIHGNLVLGSTNREATVTGYWGGRTFIFSGRYLDPNSLGTLGSQFFTTPKDARLNKSGQACNDTLQNCLSDPFQLTSGDLFLSTFRRDSLTGAFSRHSLIVLEDDYEVDQDLSDNLQNVVPVPLVKGFQGAWLYAYESVRPGPNGEWEWGFSWLNRNYNDAYRDTLPPTADAGDWNQTDNLNGYSLGGLGRNDKEGILSSKYSPNTKQFGAQTTYGVELEYFREARDYVDIGYGTAENAVNQALDRDLFTADAMYRLHWTLTHKNTLDASLGAAWSYNGPFEGKAPDALSPLPLASLRFTHPLNSDHKVYTEIATRQQVDIVPHGLNNIVAKATPSAEFKFGGDGMFGPTFRYAWSGYSRWYLDPELPEPDVFWNYTESHTSDFAFVDGGDLTLFYLPSHHFGMGTNASIINGDYHLEDGSYLPWQSNRSLDLSSNIRILPRSDSLLSFIFTYTVSDGAPLYAYTGLWDASQDRSTNMRTIEQNPETPEATRHRLDLRINLDLKSHWRPLESMRFFFEADNLFNNYDGTWLAWLGGENQRQRGWTRADPNGDLLPVVTRGLGLFIMFGLEGKLKI